MAIMHRRSVIRASLGAFAVGAISRPNLSNAAAKTATVWQVQGFVPEEDAAFRKTVADYEAASGNKIDLSVMPFQALNQKAISVQDKVKKTPLQRLPETRGRTALAVNLGATRKLPVAKLIIDAILNHEKATHMRPNFTDLNWSDYKSINYAFKQLLKKKDFLPLRNYFLRSSV